MAESGVAWWMSEVRRVCALLCPKTKWSGPSPFSPVSLEHAAQDQSPSGKEVMLWQARCHITSASADSPDAAMRALLAKLNAHVDEKIMNQEEELKALRLGRSKPKIVPGEK